MAREARRRIRERMEKRVRKREHRRLLREIGRRITLAQDLGGMSERACMRAAAVDSLRLALMLGDDAD